MTDDTDSSSSSASPSEKYKKHKKSKKLKRKSEKKKSKHKEKKEKRRKEKKRERQEKPPRIEPAIVSPPSILDSKQETAAGQDADTFGPVLPPHLLSRANKPEKQIIGPVLPQEFANRSDNEKPNEDKHSSTEENIKNDHDDEDEANDMDFSYGPMPVPTEPDGVAKLSATQIELEKRALELKLAAIDGTLGQTNDAQVREEWMLELPAVGLKSGLAALANMKRTFHQGKERPDFSDRSSWTKTPQDANNPTPSTSKSATTVEALQQKAEADYERKRDEEQARLAKKHKKDHKRDESLVEMHQKKLRKEQKKREKELAASGAKPERRPFSRDVDLKLNKIDKNQTKQIVDKAKILNTKFATGKTKYL